jgi:CDP-diacylglycerol--glycerol-3-phosphate 3-phosphatidyltransferase
MQPPASLRRSIALHGSLAFLAQAIVLVAVAVAYGMAWQRVGLALGICAAFHGLLTAGLLLRSRDFRLESTGEPLPRVNLATTLTLVRLSSIPTVAFLVIEAGRRPLLPVVLPLLAVVFLTDLLDGMAARRRGQVTFVGKYLDSTSDYLMIIAVSVLFYSFRLLPAWLFALIMARLVLFAAGMAALALRQGRATPATTFLGKASVFAIMVLYVMELAERLGVPGIGHALVVRIVEYVVAALVAVSAVDKIVFLARMFAAARRPPALPPGDPPGDTPGPPPSV